MFQNSKTIKVIATILIVVITYIFLIFSLRYLSQMNHPLCIFKLVFHMDCPGCGMTRAFYNFLLFNFEKGIDYNYKIIIVYPLLWGLYINYIYNNKYLFKGEEYGN